MIGPCSYLLMIRSQVYSNGLSEIILGNAIKKLGLRREEIVVMTKVRYVLSTICWEHRC